MKKVLLIISLTIIATLYINAQNIKFDILQLDFYKCDAVDFGLTNAKDIITVDQKHYRSNYNKPDFSLQYISEKKFSNAKLIEIQFSVSLSNDVFNKNKVIMHACNDNLNTIKVVECN